MATTFQGLNITGGGADIPAGRYIGSVRDIEQLIAKATGDPFLVWRCVVEFDGKQVDVDGTSSLNTGPQSKPRRWMKAILGREIARGEYVAREDLLGRPCVVDVEINDDGWPYVAEIRPISPASPAIREASPAGLAPANGFAEDFVAKATAAQAAAFTEEPTAPPVAVDEEIPF